MKLSLYAALIAVVFYASFASGGSSLDIGFENEVDTKVEEESNEVDNEAEETNRPALQSFEEFNKIVCAIQDQPKAAQSLNCLNGGKLFLKHRNPVPPAAKFKHRQRRSYNSHSRQKVVKKCKMFKFNGAKREFCIYYTIEECYALDN